MMELTLPLTKEKAKTLKVGDILFLTGFAYTCRDAAHKKIEVALSNGEKSPVDFQNQTIYYAGPCPARPGLPIGSNGPTTAARMDPFVEMMFLLAKAIVLIMSLSFVKNTVGFRYSGLEERLQLIQNMLNQ